jgi:hypothetical protein
MNDYIRCFRGPENVISKGFRATAIAFTLLTAASKQNWLRFAFLLDPEFLPLVSRGLKS